MKSKIAYGAHSIALIPEIIARGAIRTIVNKGKKKKQKKAF